MRRGKLWIAGGPCRPFLVKARLAIGFRAQTAEPGDDRGPIERRYRLIGFAPWAGERVVIFDDEDFAAQSLRLADILSLDDDPNEVAF